MKRIVGAVATAAAIAVAWAAPAPITRDGGAGGRHPAENLRFDNNLTPALVIEGQTNQTGTAVTVTGGELLSPGRGAPRVDTTDGKLSTAFSFNGFDDQLAGFDLTDAGKAFTSTEFRVIAGTATEVTLTFVDTAGEVFQKTFAIPANGYFNALATDGQLINYFSIAANGTVNDIRQIRIGGIQDIVTPIPEPSAWALMILGFGGAGAALRSRRRTRPAEA